MNPELAAIIREIEEQRAAMGARAAQMAGAAAKAQAESETLRKANAEKQERIAVLEAEIAALKPAEPDPSGYYNVNQESSSGTDFGAMLRANAKKQAQGGG